MTTHFQNGDYSFYTIEPDEDLRYCCLAELKDYRKYTSLTEVEGTEEEDEKLNTTSLMEKVVRIGNERVQNQDGWGVREIRKIK